ncbi:uncharacterized protein LOC122058897 [Macadamia integrifolia]|uniref:uncharacterized protein LOC122058897 n=1 Tax=Macadamia integrifolia TaxID=60698 RepID=UPI001C53007B|nr:uncharacterized protein LOC122058897 [Macadamia integrifolia]
MMKALKKLKVWSKKKKRRKSHVYQPPPATSHCCSCSYTPASAPPLPSWLDFDQIQDAGSVSAVFQPCDIDPITPQPQFSSTQTVSETTPLYAPLPVGTSSSSYQQYMVQTPVYGVPVVPEHQTEKTAGLFGCVVSIGTYLIRCFFPCFQFRRVSR